jgi:hypothetical protein
MGSCVDEVAHVLVGQRPGVALVAFGHGALEIERVFNFSRLSSVCVKP